jgi:hypothetical protein
MLAGRKHMHSSIPLSLTSSLPKLACSINLYHMAVEIGTPVSKCYRSMQTSKKLHRTFSFSMETPRNLCTTLKDAVHKFNLRRE